MKPDNDSIQDLRPSKSQRKREAQEFLDLARQLMTLPTAILATIPLDNDLARELDHLRSIRSNVARKRQLHFVAKMMRKRDCAPITEALDSHRDEARRVNERHHRAEAWRDELVEHGDEAVTRLLDAHPGFDAQSLRQLTRNAIRETRLGKPPASARKLFRLLRDLDAEQALPPPR
ncbi:MAG: ribosome biogenesis factor YjgA [Xanthomonadales bacterium]|nr:ribosome biogenesis factor YjgA [Xanthomonadales bacterium]